MFAWIFLILVTVSITSVTIAPGAALFLCAYNLLSLGKLIFNTFSFSFLNTEVE